MVLEVSSFQLESIEQFRPWIAAILNITPDHLGEVVIEVRAGTERFLARAADTEATIRKHTQVLVVGSLGGRTVEVADRQVHEDQPGHGFLLRMLALQLIAWCVMFYNYEV